ncbi:hypothetical protein [Alloscardovia macacae]|uniref:Uncharacterized protein n=1 Tax=Alloscardovia macacae TaxID=1160091 RepID=A0A261F6S3_9BIFI|nr:hypothetical protein [Alloscardovia macacae]OZG54840.1 hypothetical protein ALMA_0165 [Alloscardovia macacae]
MDRFTSSTRPPSALTRALTAFLGPCTLLAGAAVALVGYLYIADEFAQEPRYMWMYMPIMILYFLLFVPAGAWVLYTVWQFSLARPEKRSLDAYLRVTFWCALAEAGFGFLLPFTVSSVLHEGNPPMLFAWFTATMVPLFAAAIAASVRRSIRA